MSSSRFAPSSSTPIRFEARKADPALIAGAIGAGVGSISAMVIGGVTGPMGVALALGAGALLATGASQATEAVMGFISSRKSKSRQESLWDASQPERRAKPRLPSTRAMSPALREARNAALSHGYTVHDVDALPAMSWEEAKQAMERGYQVQGKVGQRQ